jgi:hypothetical protein
MEAVVDNILKIFPENGLDRETWLERFETLPVHTMTVALVLVITKTLGRNELKERKLE